VQRPGEHREEGALQAVVGPVQVLARLVEVHRRSSDGVELLAVVAPFRCQVGVRDVGRHGVDRRSLLTGQQEVGDVVGLRQVVRQQRHGAGGADDGEQQDPEGGAVAHVRLPVPGCSDGNPVSRR
jgi:hypothetical protein